MTTPILIAVVWFVIGAVFGGSLTIHLRKIQKRNDIPCETCPVNTEPVDEIPLPGRIPLYVVDR
jgi:hypothetical protein